MSLALIYWVLILIWLVFSLWTYWPNSPAPAPVWGHSVFLFVLFLLLGWAVFGAPVRG